MPRRCAFGCPYDSNDATLISAMRTEPVPTMETNQTSLKVISDSSIKNCPSSEPEAISKETPTAVHTVAAPKGSRLSRNFKKCVVCNKRRIPGSGLRLTRIPLDPRRCRLWVKAIGQQDLVYLPIEKLNELKFVCKLHFKEDDFNKKNRRLLPHAVPSLNMPLKPLPNSLFNDFPLHIGQYPKSGVSGKKITVSSQIAPELKISSKTKETSSKTKEISSKTKEISSKTKEISSKTKEISSKTNEIATEVDDDDVIIEELATDNISLVSMDNELSTEPESGRAIIARVYRYLKNEYEYMKTVMGDGCDLSPLANILKRTAEATGVTEDTVTTILEDKPPTENHIKLNTGDGERWCSLPGVDQQNIGEDVDMKLNDSLDIKCEDSTKMDMSDEVYILDLRDKETIKEEGENIDSPSSKNPKLPLGLIKAHFVAESVLSESDKTNISDISKNLLSCRWCTVREKGYNKNIWMCRQCKVSLCWNKCFKNCHRVP